jgi:hypothetical protein
VSVGTEKIKSTLQKIQNKILKIIKYFPIKTSIRTIHRVLKLETVEERANNLFTKFLLSKSKQELIASDISQYVEAQLSQTKRFKTPFDLFQELSNLNNSRVGTSNPNQL